MHAISIDTVLLPLRKRDTTPIVSLFLHTFAVENKSVFIMKIKLTTQQIKQIVDDPEAAANAKIKISDPWWLIVLKVVKYICEILIAGGAGYLAVSCSQAIGLY